jgi:hypothetical protein
MNWDDMMPPPPIILYVQIWFNSPDIMLRLRQNARLGIWCKTMPLIYGYTNVACGSSKAIPDHKRGNRKSAPTQRARKGPCGGLRYAEEV